MSLDAMCLITSTITLSTTKNIPQQTASDKIAVPSIINNYFYPIW